MNPSRLATYGIAVVASCALAACKPAAPATTAQNQTLGEPSLQTPGDARRPQPSTVELTNFIRSNLPPVLKLLEVKNDPPTPMPNTPPGSNVWLYAVRLTFAPVEDELGAAPPRDAQTFQSAVDEIGALANWSYAYAQSPYVSLYPGFAVHPPMLASPKLLAVLHAKDRPLLPIYGRMAAEWQVDHWQFSVEDLAMPADAGHFRSTYTDPILIESDPATAQFLATARSAIAEAKPKKAAIEAAYEEDLLKATRPGTIYRGQVTLESAAIPAEVHFVEPPTTDPLHARFEVRLPTAPGYLFTYNAKLAAEVPIHPAPVAGSDQPGLISQDADTVPKADLTVGLEHAGGKEIVANTLPNQLLMALTHYSPPSALPLSLLHGRLEGKIATSTGVFQLSAQKIP